MKSTISAAAAVLIIATASGYAQPSARGTASAPKTAAAGPALVENTWPGQSCDKVAFQGDDNDYALNASSLADLGIWQKVLQAQSKGFQLKYTTDGTITCNGGTEQFIHLDSVVGDP